MPLAGRGGSTRLNSSLFFYVDYSPVLTLPFQPSAVSRYKPHLEFSRPVLNAAWLGVTSCAEVPATTGMKSWPIFCDTVSPLRVTTTGSEVVVVVGSVVVVVGRVVVVVVGCGPAVDSGWESATSTVQPALTATKSKAT